MSEGLQKSFDVLIIGSGPAGATAGLLLARAGFTVAIAEKAEFPRRKVCGEYLSATNFEIFRKLGIFDEFIGLAGPEIRRVGLFSDATNLTARMPRSASSQNLWGRALRREVLDTLILGRAIEAGATVRQPFAVTKIEGTLNGFISRLESKQIGATEEISSRIVVAADGSWEIGPLSTQHRRRSSTPGDLLGFKAHFENSDLPPDLMPMIVFPGGYGGMVTCDNGFVSISCCIRRDTLQVVRDRYSDEKAGAAIGLHIFETCPGVRKALATAKISGEWLSAGPIRPGVRSRSKNGIFIVGNAAGESHPIIAEGISMAIQSSWLLCEKLKGLNSDTLNSLMCREISDSYDRDWLKAFAPRIRAAGAFAYLALNKGFHPVLAPIIKSVPSLLTLGAKLSGKVNRLVPLGPSTELDIPSDLSPC